MQIKEKIRRHEQELEKLKRQISKDTAILRRLELDAARQSKQARRERTHRLILIGAECVKLLPELERMDGDVEKIREILFSAFSE